MTSAERCSSGDSFLVGEEETPTECTDDASLDCGEYSPSRSTGESVSVVVTPLFAGSDRGELESAGWEESVPVSIRREFLISALVRPTICLSWLLKMTSLMYKREVVVKDSHWQGLTKWHRSTLPCLSQSEQRSVASPSHRRLIQTL